MTDDCHILWRELHAWSSCDTFVDGSNVLDVARSLYRLGVSRIWITTHGPGGARDGDWRWENEYLPR